MSAEIHDFDVERRKRHAEKEQAFGEKPFKFGGEVFYVRANAGYTQIKRVAALTSASSGDETFGAIEASVFSMIDPRDDALERFRKVVESVDDPITFEDLVDLQGWLITEQTSLPPTKQQPSSSTPTDSGRHLTEVSSTEPAEASTS